MKMKNYVEEISNRNSNLFDDTDISKMGDFGEVPVSINVKYEVYDEEVICGVDENCVLFPTNNNDVETTTGSTSFSEKWEYSLPEQDMLNIQVTEEVVCEPWDTNEVVNNVISEEVIGEPELVSSNHGEAEEVEIPLPQDQDAYTLMRPYPCDFCSRRFRKKANLMNHMVSHQIERPHSCNLCGVRYRRKCDLMNHMKIHAYAPGIYGNSDDEEDIPVLNYQDINNFPKVREKKNSPNSPRKKRKSNSVLQSSREISFNELSLYKNNKFRDTPRQKRTSVSSISNYVDNHMDMLSDTAAEFSVSEPQEPVTPRWPVVDESRPHVCQHCGVGFAREKALASHARVHAGDSPFECEVCGEMFWDVNLLRDHAKVKHPYFTFKEDIIENENREDSYYCADCDLSFSSHELLKRHQRVHVKKEIGSPRYMCQICGESFLNESTLAAHSVSHTRLHSHRCTVCGESFNEMSVLASHVRRQHAKNIPPNSCNVCGKTCRDKRSLQKHLRTHASEKTFPCYRCRKRFHSKARLNRHMVSHRDKAVSCEECGEEFPDGRALINHRHSHNRDSSRQFSCMECGKTFGSRSSQQIHARIHTGERPYGCRFCWKAFADGGTLRKHERIHTGEKPYVCVVCPRAFNQRVVLREHIRSHHSAPDSTHNHILVYSCSVCSASFNRADELCVHLVGHSDENTAKHRLPSSQGPKKYKRRHNRFGGSENNRYFGGRLSGTRVANTFPHVTESVSKDRMRTRQGTGKVKTVLNENLESVVKTMETVVENFSSIVHSKSDSGKRKTAKGKRRKYKSAALNSYLNNVPVKSRSTLGGFVRRTHPVDGKVRPKTKNVTSSTLAALRAVSVKNDVEAEDPSRVRPRTKNVNYHNTQMAKLEPAVFPEDENQKKRKSAVRRQGSSTRRTAAQAQKISEDISLNNSETPNSFQFPESVMVKEDPDNMDFKCEMCSETFTRRSELLIHVPIHI